MIKAASSCPRVYDMVSRSSTRIEFGIYSAVYSFIDHCSIFVFDTFRGILCPLGRELVPKVLFFWFVNHPYRSLCCPDNLLLLLRSTFPSCSWTGGTCLINLWTQDFLFPSFTHISTVFSLRKQPLNIMPSKPSSKAMTYVFLMLICNVCLMLL